MGIGAVTGARAVFLDRDGVLNEPVVRDGKPYPPPAADFRVSGGAREALDRLKAAGFLLIVVTNQPDVGRGTLAREDLDAIHRNVRAELPVDDVRVCCHNDGDACGCRKPKPGMLIEAASDYGIDLSRSFMVGDRWRDVDAGASAGCRTILIDRQYRERGPDNQPDFRASTLAAAAAWILAASL
jgi:D-glycero-D-manno-heptose 1,7-bisphosphate phosphatase